MILVEKLAGGFQQAGGGGFVVVAFFHGQVQKSLDNGVL